VVLVLELAARQLWHAQRCDTSAATQRAARQRPDGVLVSSGHQTAIGVETTARPLDQNLAILDVRELVIVCDWPLIAVRRVWVPASRAQPARHAQLWRVCRPGWGRRLGAGPEGRAWAQPRTMRTARRGSHGLGDGPNKSAAAGSSSGTTSRVVSRKRKCALLTVTNHMPSLRWAWPAATIWSAASGDRASAATTWTAAGSERCWTGGLTRGAGRGPVITSVNSTAITSTIVSAVGRLNRRRLKEDMGVRLGPREHATRPLHHPTARSPSQGGTHCGRADWQRQRPSSAAAWTLGHWVAAGALDQREVEDALVAAAEQNGLVAADGARQCWATIRSGLSAGPQQSVDLDANDRLPVRRRRQRKGRLDEEESVL